MHQACQSCPSAILECGVAMKLGWGAARHDTAAAWRSCEHAAPMLHSSPRVCPHTRSTSHYGRAIDTAISAVKAPRRSTPKAASPKPNGAAPKAPAVASQDYDAQHIQVLEGLEPVRKRPGMYIGSTGQGGLHHLVYEVLDNSIDEVQGGHATRVEIEMNLSTGWVTVTDDGRGIPTDIHPRTGKSALETVLTVLHAGGKFGGSASGYTMSGGLHGVGISVVNALSETIEVKVWRGGKQFYQRFSRGAVDCPLVETDLPIEEMHRHGTQVRFLYDHTIFSADAKFDPDTIEARLRELAFLNQEALILFKVIKKGSSRTAKSKNKPGGDENGATKKNGHSSGNGNWNALMNGSYEEEDSSEDAELLRISHVCSWKLGDPSPAAAAAPAAPTRKALRTKARSAAAPAAAAVPATIASSNSLGGEAMQGLAEAPAADSAVAAPQVVPLRLQAGSLDGVVVEEGWKAFHYEGGLIDFVAWINQGKHALHNVLAFQRTAEGIVVEVALQWCADSFNDTLVGFANSIRTVDGGTHLDGTRSALTRTVNTLAKKLKLVKDGDPVLTGEHIRDGLSGVVSVKVPNPEFEGQTKTRLGNPEVRRVVEATVAAAVGEWLELNPAALAAIVSKALTAAKAADAARKARELVRRKAVLTKTTLPGKLADCTSTRRDETELFVVEGDSAGGSAKQARDRHTQAILPLRGKILNVERKDEADMLKNNEIANLIVALGLSKKGDGCEGLRYGKVVILTDADVDGAHIRTLLLTFLFKFRRELFEQGHVYVAVPPLYKVEQSRGNKTTTWVFSDAHLQQVTKGMAAGSYTVQRFKGLGEMMPEQLWETTLDPARRQLRRLTIHDAEKASHMFTVLMGNKVGPRKQLIEEHASRFSLGDLDI